MCMLEEDVSKMMKGLFNSNKNGKKVIETPTIEINNNVLRYRDSVIQMSSVAKCEVAPMPRLAYPVWAVIGALIGLYVFIRGIFVWQGLFALLIFGGILVYIFQRNQNLDTYFILELNSGSLAMFSCSNRHFLEEAQDAVVSCFNDKGSYVINFSSCTINDSQFGDNNTRNG